MVLTSSPMVGTAAMGRTLAGVVALVTLAASSGCTNNPYPESDSSKKVLYSVFDDPPKTLDPAVAYTTAEHEVTGAVFDTLVEYHYLKRPYELIPALATQVPQGEELPGGKVRYAFELRPDLLYQEDPCFELSGKRTRAITAADFEFELKRIADPNVNSPVAEPFANIDGLLAFGKALSARRKADAAFAELPAHRQYEQIGKVQGLVVEGDSKLSIILEKPYPQILYWLAMPFAAPLPWEAVQYYDGEQGRDRLDDHPVASGPYMLSTYDKQLRIVMDKNPNWYGIRHPEWKAPGATYPAEGEPDDAAQGLLKDAGRPLPFIERIELRREKEAIPTFNKFLQGYYDSSGVIKESFDKVIREDNLSPEMAALGLSLNKSVTAGVYYIGFNMEDPVVGAKGGDPARKLRQALSLVVDFQEYARLFQNGRGVPAQSPIPPGLFGYEEGYKNPFRTVNVERGRQLLKEAGYAGGIDPNTKKPLRVTFDVAESSVEQGLRFKFLSNEWRKLGINVVVDATTYNTFQKKMRDGAFQIFTWGWIADYPDPENFLFLLWSDMARSKNNGPNTANFASAEYDKLFLQMQTMPNSEERLAIIRQMRGILEQERPWIELFHPEGYALYHAWLKNVKTPGMSLQTTKYRDLDPTLRAGKRSEWNKPVLAPAFALLALAIALVLPGIRTFMRERQ
jgi:oligopeptide transport system substrate-binding protein